MNWFKRNWDLGILLFVLLVFIFLWRFEEAIEFFGKHVDGKKIGKGIVGPITKKLQEIYFSAVKGDNPKYSDWLTPVY